MSKRKKPPAKRDPLVQAYMDRDGMSEVDAKTLAAAVRAVLGNGEKSP